MKVSVTFLLFLPVFLSAQPSIEWEKTYGGSEFDEPKCILQTSDGGYIMTGDVISNDGDVFGNHGGNDFWVLKLNSLGLVEWKKCYGGTNNDWPYSIQQTNDGGYIVVGFTESVNGDVSGNHGDKDAWVVKLADNGTIQWKKCFGGTLWEEARSIIQTTDGGYIFAGIAQSSDGDVSGVHGNSLDFWIVKLSNAGAIEWQKAFGGNGEEIARSIKQTQDGGYIVAGKTFSFDGDVVGNHGNVDYWVVKLTNNGELQWQKPLGGAGLDDAFDIDQTDNGDFVVSGYSGSGNTGLVTGHHGGTDFWIVRLTESGEFIWQKALGGSSEDLAYSGAPTHDDGFVIAGQSLSTNGDVTFNHGYRDFWILKLNASGELLWQKTYGGSQSESAFSIEQTTDNGFIMCGYSWSTDGDVTGGIQGYDDFWIVKLAPESSATTTPPAYPLNIYPNPAQQSITLNLPTTAASLNVCISDILGRSMLRQTGMLAEAGSISLEVSGLPAGVYLVSAVDADGRVYSGRFLKE